MELEFNPYTLNFSFEARTSRGSMSQRNIWVIKLKQDGKEGIGEVAPIARLSPDKIELIPEKLEEIQTRLPELKNPAVEIFDLFSKEEFPSVHFGLEMALLDLRNGGGYNYFPSKFTSGEMGIPINGLVWMSDKEQMISQIDRKLEQGFDCIKIKVGALDFEDELEVLQHIRSKSSEVTIRLDANGGFQTHQVLFKLKDLAHFNIHSIEQPIAPRQPEAMKLLVSKSPIPIAFDEELIGVFGGDKEILLSDWNPHYIVLKPSLLGGFKECEEWINIAQNHHIGWWITSYLESNIGLNAICQFTANIDQELKIPHGLGTGGLFRNNFESNLEIREGVLWKSTHL